MKIFQILPDVFENNILTREAMTLQVYKKYTGSIVHFLKSFIIDKNVFVKFKEDLNIDHHSYGKYYSKLKKFGDFVQTDISFLKMVKSVSNDENLIIIGFLEVLTELLSIWSI